MIQNNVPFWKIGMWMIILALSLANISLLWSLGGEATVADNNVNEKKPMSLDLTYIKDPGCPDCFNIELVESELGRLAVAIGDKEILESTSSAGKKLIEKYAITKLPTVIIEGKINENATLAELWPRIGKVVDGVFILTDVQPPYMDLETGTKRGDFGIVLLTDLSCKECYDVTLHQNALEGLAMVTDKIEIYDAATPSAKKYIKDYKIVKLPTLIVTGDADAYPGFKQVWPGVGTNEPDGAYVFRSVEQMGTYRDLETGKVVVVAK
ncbi:MAG: hypothetical protein G01um101418_588 [Parcubacteria group bacterium Gr01-1014_18]|nr:MAG: hypothetical protein Greene041636_121 [Parcubacteria group bacterium Greene0416_36]TSC80840.1 MAG: hypothetical protein G01um101418_588 [Parcubacteria group bacterium Gr01-1014_18]TSC99501.1 MAG: hypothetical protein Greene101420_168 [Parcubacteria group bacterium Greene1014_20]TSD07580.1 MAG: hypothetical protein Greene07142_37 [Parcubacteria group bacterium Greene0714_2]